MATVRSRRRALRAVDHVSHPVTTPARRLSSLLGNPAVKTGLVLVGTLGITALAVALVGPKRIERDVIKPLRGAIEPQAEKLWADSKPLREQFAGVFRTASPAGRERLVKSFQSWIGHFHAT